MKPEVCAQRRMSSTHKETKTARLISIDHLKARRMRGIRVVLTSYISALNIHKLGREADDFGSSTYKIE